MTHTLHYRSTRLGVWRFYWRNWRRGIWRFHLAFAVMMSLVMVAIMPAVRSVPGWAAAFGGCFAVILVMSSAYPLFRFRSAERVLVVSESGWSTQVGERSGARSWSKTLPVFEQAGAVVIPSSNNTALVIPVEAFASEVERRQFIQDVKQWQSRFA